MGYIGWLHIELGKVHSTTELGKVHQTTALGNVHRTIVEASRQTKALSDIMKCALIGNAEASMSLC